MTRSPNADERRLNTGSRSSSGSGDCVRRNANAVACAGGDIAGGECGARGDCGASGEWGERGEREPSLMYEAREPPDDRDAKEPPGEGGSRRRASSALCTKWHRGPYGQNPTEWNVRHSSVLYLGWRCKLRSSRIPCANWHLSPYLHTPASSKGLQSSVLYLLVAGGGGAGSLVVRSSRRCPRRSSSPARARWAGTEAARASTGCCSQLTAPDTAPAPTGPRVALSVAFIVCTGRDWFWKTTKIIVRKYEHWFTFNKM